MLGTLGYGVPPRVIISQSKMPKLQTSDWMVYLLWNKASGAIHFTGSRPSPILR